MQGIALAALQALRWWHCQALGCVVGFLERCRWLWDHGVFSSQEGSAQGVGLHFARGWQPESCVGNTGFAVLTPMEPGLSGQNPEHPP